MAFDPATIGSLAAAATAVAGAIKSVLGLFRSKSPQVAGEQTEQPIDAVKQTFQSFQHRLEILAVQLEQTETLSRMLPVWLMAHSKIDVWDQSPSKETIKFLDQSLRDFCHQSVTDYFSAMFFRTQFDKIPKAQELLDKIRVHLQSLNSTLQAIPQGDTKTWQTQWGGLKIRLHDLRMEVEKLNRLAYDIRGDLIRELQDAARSINLS